LREASQRIEYDYYVVEGLVAVLGLDVEESVLNWLHFDALFV